MRRVLNVRDLQFHFIYLSGLTREPIAWLVWTKVDDEKQDV